MEATATVLAIMKEFAERTGLSSPVRPARRYLWTDAFAVCNYLGLSRQTDEKQHLDTALQLIGQVHRVLGRHRDDDARSGWISGLSEEEGARHPTQGGLRIGKPHRERERGEPFDQELEWERDGQYFHYLSKWMHALDRASQVADQPELHRFAVELARAAHAGFTYRSPADHSLRMAWKMSTDLSYPLVPTVGQHDALDGLITFRALQATSQSGPNADGLSLDREIREMEEMCAGSEWRTHDLLGIGGLLGDACRLAQLVAATGLRESTLVASLLADAEFGLGALAYENPLRAASDYRLAFRELGLAIGLHALPLIEGLVHGQPEAFPNRAELEFRLGRLQKYRALTEQIEGFWLEPRHRASASFRAHLDINSVMLASALAPAGFLQLKSEELSGA